MTKLWGVTVFYCFMRIDGYYYNNHDNLTNPDLPKIYNNNKKYTLFLVNKVENPK